MALGIGKAIRMISSPAGQTLGALWGGHRYNKENERVRQENLRRYNQILAGYGNLGADARTQQAQRAGREFSFLEGANRDILGAQDRLTRGYRTRYNRFMPGMQSDQAQQRLGYQQANQGVMDTLGQTQQDVLGGYADLDKAYTGLYDQVRADAAKRAGELDQQNQAMLADRGFGGSTIQSSLAGTNKTRLDEEMRRIAADEAQAKLGVRERGINAQQNLGLTRAEAQRMLSDRSLSAEERQNAARYLYDTALSGDVLNQQAARIGYQGQGLSNLYNQMAQSDQDALNLYLQTEGNRLGFMERRDDPYPQMDPSVYRQMGYNAGPLPKSPSLWQTLFPSLIGGGAQVASAGLLAGGFSGGGGSYSPYVNTSMPQYPGGWGPPSY